MQYSKVWPDCPVIFYDEQVAMDIHQELFHYDGACYRQAGIDLLPTLHFLIPKETASVHIAATWKTVLFLGLGFTDPAVRQTRDFLCRLLGDERKADLLSAIDEGDSIEDIFSVLLVQKRFDLLGKVCKDAAQQIQGEIRRKRPALADPFFTGYPVTCYLVSPATGTIVAGSL